MNAAWGKFEADLNALTDAQIDAECQKAMAALEEAEEWLEAVEAWRADGSPRREPRP